MKVDFYKFFKICEFKGVEIDFRILDKTISYFDISISWTKNTSHAGYHSYLSLFGISFEFNIYDIRHWDGILNGWEALSEAKTADDWELGI